MSFAEFVHFAGSSWRDCFTDPESECPFSVCTEIFDIISLERSGYGLWRTRGVISARLRGVLKPVRGVLEAAELGICCLTLVDIESDNTRNAILFNQTKKS